MRPRPPETGRNVRDTPCLYALYSVVFRCRMHTNPARNPYSRKGFQICIQCIQRIPTPFVFVFSLLLGREYMNTVNTSGRNEPEIRTSAARPFARRRRPVAPSPAEARLRARFVFSDPREYMPNPARSGAATVGISRNRPRHTLIVCIVFSCIQMPNAYKISPLALLP